MSEIKVWTRQHKSVLDKVMNEGRYIAKWGAILNYSYIPADEADRKRHHELLEMYGVDDVKAFMTQFYPAIKKELVASWDRLFDDNVKLGNDLKYGTIWEIRKEWVTKVIQ